MDETISNTLVSLIEDQNQIVTFKSLAHTLPNTDYRNAKVYMALFHDSYPNYHCTFLLSGITSDGVRRVKIVPKENLDGNYVIII
jgi:hypothetical protein